MMSRTQITLDPLAHRQARRRAADLGISLAEYLRRLVQKDLGAPRKRVDVTCIFNIGDGGESNVAIEKDQMIAEALEADLQRGSRR
jgi:hypothetical protein